MHAKNMSSSKLNLKRKTILALLFTALIATAVLPALGHPLVSNHVASAAGGNDPIATGSAYQDQYDSIIVQYANAYGLNPFLVKAQIMLESNFNTYAQSTVVNAACGWTHDEGLMQVNPYCSGAGGANLFNPATNIQIGTSIMSQLYHQFGSYDLALQAYNIGSNAVANGQRNWAYSNQVNAYAQQFENAHASNYGSASYTVASSSSTVSSINSGTYIVQSGDTLYIIGQRFGVSWQAIAQANGIYSPYILHVGEPLRLTGSTSTYTVRSGDTLYLIGQSHGVSWESIASANGISSPYVIYPGEGLVIP